MNKKRYYLAVVMLLSFLIISQTTTAQENYISKSRGVWMWGSTLSNSNLQTVVNKLSDNYVNEVFLLVKGAAGTRTSETILTNFINLSHEKNIKIHFWLVVSQDGVYQSMYPNSCIYHSPDPPRGYINPYPITAVPSLGDPQRINLLYPGYKEYIMDHLIYFLNNFDCDGIHLDYIRYAHLVYSFDEQHLERGASIGIDTTKILNLFRNNYASFSGTGWINAYKGGDPDIVKWVNMRSQIVYEYIEAIRDTIQKYKPHAELTASFMPEGAYAPADNEPHYSQSYTLNSPLLSRIFPMAYFRSYGQSPSWVQSVTRGAINLVDPSCKISTGIQSFNDSGQQPITPAEMTSQINYALQGGAHGVVIFRYATTTDAQWEAIKPLYEGLTDVEDILSTPLEFSLQQNYPNPFNPTTNIKFSLEKPGITKLTVFDIMGKEIETLVNGNLPSGAHEVSFNASNYSSGVYYYKLQSNNTFQVKKMMLLK